MKIKQKACGDYQTNCYIIDYNNKQLIIDAGVNATEWVLKNVTNPIAILNTHGHFDHIWSNKELKEKLEIPIYINKLDSFFLEKDPFGQKIPKSKADFEINGDTIIKLDDFKIEFKHFAGHTPGSSTIEIGNYMFSGDFIFNGSIGRVDFPYSNPKDMKKSINKFLKLNYNKTIYAGHGATTTIKDAQKMLPRWLKVI